GSLHPGNALECVRDMKLAERNNRARIGRRTNHPLRFHRHRENAQSITLQQKLRIDHLKQNARQDLQDEQDSKTESISVVAEPNLLNLVNPVDLLLITSFLK